MFNCLQNLVVAEIQLNLCELFKWNHCFLEGKLHDALSFQTDSTNFSHKILLSLSAPGLKMFKAHVFITCFEPLSK